VARLSFSLGTADEHAARVVRLRELAERARRPVAVLADLPGPKLRVVVAQSVALTAGEEITFDAGAVNEGALVIVLAGHPVEGGERMPTLRIVRVAAGGASVQP
jgi:pyruvate kinase